MLVVTMLPAKKGGPVEMSFELLSCVGPENHVLGGVQIPFWRGHFLGTYTGQWTYLQCLGIWPVKTEWWSASMVICLD